MVVDEKGEEVLAADLRTIKDLDPEYTLADTDAKRRKLAASLESQERFCFDIETTSLDRFEAKLLGISFSWKSGTAIFW